jgi:hypothetical protein
MLMLTKPSRRCPLLILPRPSLLHIVGLILEWGLFRRIAQPVAFHLIILLLIIWLHHWPHLLLTVPARLLPPLYPEWQVRHIGIRGSKRGDRSVIDLWPDHLVGLKAAWRGPERLLLLRDQRLEMLVVILEAP